MANIKVAQEEFSTAQNELGKAVMQMEQALLVFSTGRKAMEGNWNGAAGSAYQGVCQMIEKLIHTNVAKLEELKGNILTAQTEFVDTDSTSAGSF